MAEHNLRPVNVADWLRQYKEDFNSRARKMEPRGVVMKPKEEYDDLREPPRTMKEKKEEAYGQIDWAKSFPAAPKMLDIYDEIDTEKQEKSDRLKEVVTQLMSGRGDPKVVVSMKRSLDDLKKERRALNDEIQERKYTKDRFKMLDIRLRQLQKEIPRLEADIEAESRATFSDNRTPLSYLPRRLEDTVEAPRDVNPMDMLGRETQVFPYVGKGTIPPAIPGLPDNRLVLMTNEDLLQIAVDDADLERMKVRRDWLKLQKKLAEKQPHQKKQQPPHPPPPPPGVAGRGK